MTGLVHEFRSLLRYAPSLWPRGRFLWLTTFSESDYRKAVICCVGVHWLMCAILLGVLVYRPVGTRMDLFLYWGLLLTLVGCLCVVTYLVLAHRRLRPWLLFAFCFLDAVLASASIVVGGGFMHDFHHLFYFPVVAAAGFVLGSVRANLCWCTAVAAFYVVVAVVIGDGFDFGAREGKVLIVRVLSIYVVNLMVALVCRFERRRLTASFAREQALLTEQVAVSQSLHDTAAQSAYVVSLGLDSAAAALQGRDSAVYDRLRATSDLARGMVWELRHLIDVGVIYEGETLRSALRSHAVSFENVTSVPTEFVVSGDEPELSLEVRRGLFTVAHNALANAYRHAGAGHVLVELVYAPDYVRVTVSDDGVGLPDDYAERGQGFGNMGREVERLGGELVVQRVGPLGGATVGAVVPIRAG